MKLLRGTKAIYPNSESVPILNALVWRVTSKNRYYNRSSLRCFISAGSLSIKTCIQLLSHSNLYYRKPYQTKSFFFNHLEYVSHPLKRTDNLFSCNKSFSPQISHAIYCYLSIIFIQYIPPPQKNPTKQWCILKATYCKH